LFERPQSGERAILVHAGLNGAPDDSEREEFRELAVSAGAVVADEIVSNRRRPDPRYFIGKGKLDELAQSVEENAAELVISSAALSPSQERNLEKQLKCRVLDRAGLILDIFAQRARSFEGKLQVELAQLSYLLPRLTRRWRHLSRQAGGIGTRGVGETQLEIDRRLISRRMAQLRGKLAVIERDRRQEPSALRGQKRLRLRPIPSLIHDPIRPMGRLQTRRFASPRPQSAGSESSDGADQHGQQGDHPQGERRN